MRIFELINLINEMLPLNASSILELIQMFPDNESCIKHLEEIRWLNEPVSPFDPESTVYKCKGGRYKCKNTGKYFNVKTGTIFDNTKVPLPKWFLAIWLITSHKKGISSLQLGRDINVTQKTAWFMLHRVRNCFGMEADEQLSNEVEIDETYVGGKNSNRHDSKKHFQSQGRNNQSKTPVLGMVERGGLLIAKKVENTGSDTITPAAIKTILKDSVIYTDEWLGYKKINQHYEHHVIKHGAKEFVRGRVHTNTIEGFWGLLKRGIVGIYHFVSVKHLQRYIDEFAFRYNTRNTSDYLRFNALLARSANRTKYDVLTKV